MSDTFESLRAFYTSCRGQSTIDKSGTRSKKFHIAVVTPCGNIEQSKWVERISKLIHDSGEDKIQTALRVFCTDNCIWLHTKAEIDLYALELHSIRIFENEKWVHYHEFRKQLYNFDSCRVMLDGFMDSTERRNNDDNDL